MPVSEFTPTVAQVGALLRARTQDDNGNELGTFTEATRPNGEQVRDLVGSAASRVGGKVSADLPDALLESAREVAAIRAAMMVELSYFPEQVGTDQSAYTELKELYNEGLAELQEAFLRIGADEAAGTDDDRAAGSPVYAFPEDRGGLVGWQTVM